MKIDFSDYTLGAGLATDLVNTSPLVRRSTGEVLVDPAALQRFLAEYGIRPDALVQGRRPTDGDLEQVHALRQEIRGILEATSEDDAVDGATALVMRAGRGPALYRDAKDRWQWYIGTAPHAPLADELAVLMGAGLLGALRTLSHDRFRHCSSPVCDGMFVDTSRAGRRRYCMPDVCGNRLNVANYRARQQGSGDGPSAGRAQSNR
ncbi:CGNR zinc finger domain-containing protein [Streptomyces inhibens]|uniref:CGNR zinc finger domain-containing protein n=1 Tax=Streptomyces inhibens TaxID=2293571 RepID=UPI001EE729E0|nr:CGNR zinc finger domain-containing protein [Streptomyces inhibens]UKY53513.1 CGNR zinc finger domain-containing protein [Streptomyces inhibens]